MRRLSVALVLTLAACSKESTNPGGSSSGRDAASDSGVRDTGVADTGSTSDGGNNCGNVTFEGECMGNTARYCDPDDGLIEVDCEDDPFDDGTICEEITQDYGFYCATAVGKECVVGDELEVVPCRGVNPGCVETATASACIENLGPCDGSDDDTCKTTRLLLLACQDWEQPHLFDCSTFGGTCEDGACIDLTLGSYCDDQDFVCADGLDCMDDECKTGTSSGADAGVAD